MMTIVTQVELKDSAEREWDAEENPKKRVIVGTWKSRADWEEWHQDPLFAETRRQLDALVNGTEQHGWYDVLLDVRKSRATGSTRSRA
jgi:heme-degrading monooxygenase HmoA